MPVSTWSAGFDQADVEDVQIAGNNVKKYTNTVFIGVEFLAPTVDATAMTGFHLDYLDAGGDRPAGGVQDQARGLRCQWGVRRR